MYFPAILKQVEQYDGKLLAASEKQQVVEDNWLRGRMVLWEFPDVETVQKCNNQRAIVLF